MIELNSNILYAAAVFLEGPSDVFTGQLQIATKEEYLAFRGALKAEINALAAKQVEYRLLTREYGGNSSAQCQRNYKRVKITALIALRRAGKVWSATQAKLALETCAIEAEVAKTS